METAFKQWQFENKIHDVDPVRDELYGYDGQEQKTIKDARPWKQDPNYFKHVRVSAIALLKMTMHARAGGSIEVMGLLQGSIHGDTFVVSDCFRLPVEGTETRVNAQEEANEYMVNYLNTSRQSGRLEDAIGWYHSHPGYGCWLSGIDVATQSTHQSYNDPFLAIVVDPERTMSAGKVDIGAFRTYPTDYRPLDADEASTDSDGFQAIPMDKMQDFGAHSDRYYPLDVSHFKSTLDAKLLAALWNKYWVATLSSNPLLTNRDYGTKQIKDLASKIQDANRSQSDHRPHGAGGGVSLQARKTDFLEPDAKLVKISKAGARIEAEERAGLISSTVKSRIFKDVSA